MRIGIDFRMLSCGPAFVHRGMGRFVQQQLREVLRLGGAHRFVLLLLADHDPDLLLPEIAAAPHVERVVLPAGLGGPAERQPEHDRLRHAAAFSAFLADLDLDVFHAATPLLPADPAFSRRDSGALVANHFDLAPLVYREHYFQGVQGAQGGQGGEGAPSPQVSQETQDPRLRRYLLSVRELRHADRLLAISEFVRREAQELLGIARERIDVAYPVADPWCRVLAPAETASRLAELRRRGRLPDEFVLSVTHLHHAKNLMTLLRAYALQPPAWRRRLPLVLGGDFDPECRRLIARSAGALGIGPDVLLTGLVADEELAALYNAATVLVHPSRHEGFGLPVLEAMACGAAVIAADAAALPEVAGEAGLLVDPEDPAALAAALDRLTGDPGLRRELRTAAVAQAARFSPRRLGEVTLAAYERAADDAGTAGRTRHRQRPGRRRLAIWSPLPPLPSGVSDYTMELLGAIGGWAEAELFIDDGYLPDPAVLDAWPVFHFTAFERRQRWRPFDLVIYQLGNSLFHLYIADAALRWPGLLVLHDLGWGYVCQELFAHGWPEAEIDRELLDREGAEALAEHLALRRLDDPAARTAGTEDFLNRRFLLRPMIAASLGQVHHLAHATRELTAAYPGTRVFAFPMGVADPWLSLPAGGGAAGTAGGTAEIRRLHGLPPDAFVVGVFGIADPVKRLETVVRALARLAAGEPRAMLIVVGQFGRRDYRRRIKELARELGVAERLRIFDRVARDRLDQLLVACDAIVNLRFPFQKQMSATLVRAMAAGKPLAISPVPEWDDFPSTFCYRIAASDTEDAALARWLAGLAADPEQAAVMAGAAREHYLRTATLQQMSDHYRSVAEELLGETTGAGSPAVAPGETAPAPPAPPAPVAPAPEATAGPGPRHDGTPESEDRRAGEPAAAAAPPAACGMAPAPAPPVNAGPAGTTPDLEQAFARWDAVTGRSRLVEASQGSAPARAAGFVRRTLRRVRDLGTAWDRGRELLRALIDRVAAHGEELAQLRGEAASRRGEVAVLRGEVERLQGELERVVELHTDRDSLAAAQYDLTARLQTLAARFGGLAVRQQTVEQGLLGHSRALLAVEESLDAAKDGSPAGELRPETLADLLAWLEREVPALGRATAIAVSARGPLAAEIQRAAAARFGVRMAARGPAVHYPCDAWVHVDLVTRGERRLVLENAASLLARGGSFLLVAAAGAAPPTPSPLLRPAGERDLEAVLGRPARLRVWERIG